MLRQGLSYRGQTEIFGEAYLALYEPISCDGAVIGLLFAGIRKASAMAEAEPAGARWARGLGAIGAAIGELQRIIQEQGRRGGQATAQRPGRR